MNGKFALVLFSAALLILTGCKNNESDILYDRKYIDEIKKTREEISLFLSGNLIPGGTFAVAREGKIIYSEGIGLASKDLEVPVTRQTKFRIGQLSEIFTAAIYQKMVEDNTLHPDSAVQFYWPEFPDMPYEIPVRHLVSHTSGIRAPSPKEKEERGLNISLQQGINFFKNDSPEVRPGVLQIPGMFNYNLLGAIMENVTGESFPAILKEYITETMNLTNTLVDHPFITIKGRSDFFEHNFVAHVVPATSRDMRFRAPSEGLLSNAEDLVKFGNALLRSDYFSEEIKKRMFEPVRLSDGRTAQMNNGWIILKDKSGRTVYGRSGKVPGGGAALLVYPDDKLVVACATNVEALLEDYPVFSIAGHFLQEKADKTK